MGKWTEVFQKSISYETDEEKLMALAPLAYLACQELDRIEEEKSDG